MKSVTGEGLSFIERQEEMDAILYPHSRLSRLGLSSSFSSSPSGLKEGEITASTE